MAVGSSIATRARIGVTRAAIVLDDAWPEHRRAFGGGLVGMDVDHVMAGEQTERIRHEIVSFLIAAKRVDLGTIYRAVGHRLETASSISIASVLSRLVRERTIEIDVVPAGRDGSGPVIGFVSLCRSASDQGRRAAAC
ncbi:MAG: hypothetical protein HY815_06875 [Candidatus Riflebacteria bacterium]|nr:hypothetical protein [Candidatus Riflebacteria bacterium]